ncbi:hypothetical protein CEXT_256371 [Caerostris extrusa]|uniref:Uncharacterized protein n=1 Tax=Caerostris extrusa TaxID=172846 RepID=A0AAV4M8F1_CAEEX|nr:hypothetical protein CEXT_256371 [Caerostris extrusa]
MFSPNYLHVQNCYFEIPIVRNCRTEENPSTNRLASTTSIVPKGQLLRLVGIPKTPASTPWKTPSAFDPVFKTFNYGYILPLKLLKWKEGVEGGDEVIVVPLRTNGRGLNG